jgi:hypothetical protein
MAQHGEYREEFHGEHPHSYDHHEPKYRLIAGLGIVTVVLLVGVGIAIQMYYENLFERETHDRVLAQPSWQLDDLRKKEQQELSGYVYIDKAKGTVRIPIDQAMRLVAKEAAENRVKYPTNSYPVKTADQLATSPAVSQPGAAATNATQNQGVTSSPNVQQSTTPQQPKK